MSGLRDDILKDLAAGVAARLRGKRYCNCSLLGGDLGEVMFLYYYSRIDNSYELVADGLLDKVLGATARFSHAGTYCNGLSGLGVGLSMLEHDGFVSGVTEALAELDDSIDATFADWVRQGKIDFLHGYLGYGIYFLWRYATDLERAKRGLMAIVTALVESAIRDGDRLKWQMSDEPDKRFNISLSHGMSSIVILFCKVLGAIDLTADERLRVEMLIEGAVRYILAQRIDPEKYGSWFASTSLECEPQVRRSRLGWCYGDMGVAIALYDAGEALQCGEWRKMAIDVLEYAALHRRNPAENAVYDAGVCHGAAGVAQLFKTMSERTSSQALVDAWRYWDNMVDRCVRRVGGRYEYLFYNPPENRFEQRHGLLDGSAGIGLYLLDAGNVLPRLLIID